MIPEGKTYTGKRRLERRRAVISIALAAVFVALAIALEALAKAIPHIELPQGGTISLTCLPLMMSGLTLGPGWGILSGAIYGVFNFLLDGYGFSWGSFLFDYLIAFALIGLSGIFSKEFLRGRIWALIAGAAIGMLGRYLSHCISGAVFFADYAPVNVNPVLYSFVLYNAPYCLGSLALDLVVGLVIFKPYQSLLSLSGLDPLFLPIKRSRVKDPAALAIRALNSKDSEALKASLSKLLQRGEIEVSEASEILRISEGGTPSQKSLKAVKDLIRRGGRYLVASEVEKALKEASPR